jgi:hypothetical protein
MTHACNPSYSGGRDQADHSLKPALANSSWHPISKKKKKNNKKGLVEWLKVKAVSSKPSTAKKKVAFSPYETYTSHPDNFQSSEINT